MTRVLRAMAGTGLALVLLAALAAPVVAPNDPGAQFPDRAYAPPMRAHLRDADGWHPPFVYRPVLVDRLARAYRDDTSRRVPLEWGRRGRLVSVAGGDAPLLWLGADALGRDLFARLLFGARLSLGVALLGAMGALVVGAVLGAIAGTFSRRLDTAVMAVADFVLVLPAVYLVLVLRAALPLVLATGEIFWLMAGLFTLAGWPHVARGVRAIVATERARDYAEAARAVGAGPFRLVGHLLPAARGFLLTEAVLLVPALLVAESTISFAGLGFQEPDPSWGKMMLDAANIGAATTAPWILAPACALFFVVLALQLTAGSRSMASALIDTQHARR